MFQTEFNFMLPTGYVDKMSGVVYKEGVMRMATAADEILPLRDPRVQQNPGYMTVIILARVITRLGDLPAVDTGIVENLFTRDLAYLQDLYTRINGAENPVYTGVCPSCNQMVDVPINFMQAGQ